MSTRGYTTYCDGCGVEAADKRANGMVRPALAGWIHGAMATGYGGLVKDRFDVCSSECLLTYATNRVPGESEG